MDPNLLRDFRLMLQSGHEDSSKPISEIDHLGCKFWWIRESQTSSRGLKKLKEIIPITFPFLLACKSDLFWKDGEEEKSVVPSSVTRRKKTSSSSSVNESSSFCGSPLKLDVIADLSAIDESCVQSMGDRHSTIDCGLSVKNGRKILSLFSTVLTDRKNSLGLSNNAIPMVAVLCDAKHIQPLSGISVKALFDKQNNFVGLKSSEIISKEAEECVVYRKTKLNFGTPDVTCHAKYDLLTETDSLLPSTRSSLRMTFQWKKRSDMTLVPLLDPPMESKAVVNVQVTSGNRQSPAFSLFQEIEILRSLVQGLNTTQVDWVGTQERPLVESLEELVEQLKLGCNVVEHRQGETTSDECLLDDILTLNERNDFDFTDHLWKDLKNCTSYTELVEAFSYIISIMKTGELQPYIQGPNNTTIAVMVRDSYKGEMRIPSLVGLRPIQYLAEIGILKLTRDYVFLLNSKNLATIGNLDYFIKDNLELGEKLERLAKLHNILEVVLMLKQYVNLPQSVLTDCTRQMLKHYETHGIENNTFFFVVSAKDVSHIAEKYSPVEWRAEGLKLVDKYEEKMKYIFTVEQPLDWIEFNCERKRNKSESFDREEDSLYFQTIVRETVMLLAKAK